MKNKTATIKGQRGEYTGYSNLSKKHHFSMYNGATLALDDLEGVQFDPQYETGATTHATNDLILFTDNTRELAELRDSIYREYQKPVSILDSPEMMAKSFRKLFLAAKEQYIKELTVHASKHIIEMSPEQVEEFCALYVSDFENWKLDHQ